MSPFFLKLFSCMILMHHQCLGHPCKETPSVNPNGTKINCNGLHLDYIPRDLPRDTVWLDFSNNNLYNLTNYMFHDLPMLVHLDLTTCQISRLDAKAFTGLENLQDLILAHNDLDLDEETYPVDIFVPLTRLTYLDIGGNDGNSEGKTPDNIFTNLPNLKTICIDTFVGEIFGSGFSAMTKLKSLILSDVSWRDKDYYCGITYLWNTTFLMFENSSIEILNMESCKLYEIETGVYLPLRYLSEIVLTHADNILVQPAIKALFGVNGKNITRLKFDTMYSKSPTNDIYKQVIMQNTLTGLSDLCVHYMDLSNNDILFIHADFVSTFGTCIRHLDVSRNSLHGSVAVLFFLSACVNLEYFDVSHQQNFARGKHVLTKYDLKNMTDKYTITLPPKLKVFNISSISGNFGNLDNAEVVNGSELRTFNVSYNGIKDMMYHIKGIANVEDLDISGNNGEKISGEFMLSFPHVKHLAVNGIYLQQLALTVGSSFYSGIKSLIHVESISFENNNIQYLGYDIFDGMMNLTSISLADNTFVNMPFDVSVTPRLDYLDLSLNSFSYLTTDTTFGLDRQEQKHGFYLKLKQNPLVCSCQTLDFIQWLFTTRVVLDQGGNYNCMTDDGVLTTTLEVYQHWNYHWTKCQGRIWLPFAITFLFLVTMIILLAFLMVRNWTRVQQRIMVILGRGVQRATREDFRYDAYIAHSEDDGRLVLEDLKENLEKFNLRLILPDRDFLPGRYVADNVVESVNNSWKTVLIITDSFLNDPWSYFIMRTVSYSVSYANSNRVILFVIGDVNRGRLPESLLNVTEEEDILQTDDFPDPDSKVWFHLGNRILSKAP